jgi:hypothetical protein
LNQQFFIDSTKLTEIAICQEKVFLTVCQPYFVTWYFGPLQLLLQGVQKTVKLSHPDRGIKSYSITVYDRWGMELFRFNEGTNDFSSINLSAGVYFIVVNAIGNDNIRYSKNQTLTILR